VHFFSRISVPAKPSREPCCETAACAPGGRSRISAAPNERRPGRRHVQTIEMWNPPNAWANLSTDHSTSRSQSVARSTGTISSAAKIGLLTAGHESGQERAG
jgi:hypothetical protein